MIPIYLCDDEPDIRQALCREIKKEILISGYDMEIAAACAGPEELLCSLRKNKRRGIYFLDVDLKDDKYTGFTLGQAIRREDPRGFLVYVTAFGELAFETFRYQLEALDYIVKDDREKMFAGIRKCLASVVERMQNEKDDTREYFTVKFMDTVRHIPMDEILFFETGSRRNSWISPEASRNWNSSWEKLSSGYTGPIWQTVNISNIWMQKNGKWFSPMVKPACFPARQNRCFWS